MLANGESSFSQGLNLNLEVVFPCCRQKGKACMKIKSRQRKEETNEALNYTIKPLFSPEPKATSVM